MTFFCCFFFFFFFFISASAAGNTAWTRRLCAHVSAAALPDAKRGPWKKGASQVNGWLIYGTTITITLHTAPEGMHWWSCNFISCFRIKRGQIKKSGRERLALAEKSLEERLADKSIRSMCQCGVISNRPPDYKDDNRMFVLMEPSWNAFMPRCQRKRANQAQRPSKSAQMSVGWPQVALFFLQQPSQHRWRPLAACSFAHRRCPKVCVRQA